MKYKLWEYLREQYRGKDPTYKNINDDIFKSIKEGWCDAIGYVPEKPMAIIGVTKQNSNILEDISCSAPNDLLVDNFGIALAAILSSGNNQTRTLTDNFGNPFVSRFNSSGSNYNTTQTSPTVRELGMAMVIGRNTDELTPQRSDFQLFAPFAPVPESLPFKVDGPNSFGSGFWDESGQQVLVEGTTGPTSIVPDEIREAGLLAIWGSTNTGFAQEILISHDEVFATFGPASNIKLAYTWSIV